MLTGINTHARVRTTAIDAYQRDLEAIFAAECLGRYDEHHSANAMKYMSDKIISIEDSRGLKERLKAA